METRKSWCGLCHSRCGTLLEFEGDRAVKVKGDSGNPFSRGRICQRGALMLEHLYHKDRLNFPLKRNGDKGAGKFKRLTWEAGMDEVAGRLLTLKDKYGPETLAFSHGTYRTYHWDGKRFFNLFGSPNMAGANHICYCPTHSVDWASYGSFAFGDMMHASLIVVWGHSPSQSYPIVDWGLLGAARDRGAKIIVVDPRRTKEVEIADLWLQIKPGTDLALMLGWLKVIVEEDLYDKDFVKKWTVGLPELKGHLKKTSLEETARITWVPQDQILKSARMYAQMRPGVITKGLGIEKQGINSNQAQRARAILRALCGNIDVPGGELIGYAEDMKKIVSDYELQMQGALSPEQKKKQLGSQQFKLLSYAGWDKIAAAGRRQNMKSWGPPDPDLTACAHPAAVWKAILEEKPYPVKAMIILAANPLLTLPNPRLIKEALKKLELLVVMDYYLTPTAQLADYVFPAASTVERPDIVATPAYCAPCPKGLEPLYERKPDYHFWRELGIRCGQEEQWQWETVEEVLDYRLAPLGLTFSELVKQGAVFASPEYKKYEQEGFGTPSGKVEISSRIFEELGYDPLPIYKEIDWPWEDPAALVLITGSNFLPMYHSEQRQWPSARKIAPDPLTTLNPETAQSLGLQEGDWVEIETSFGKIRQKLRVSDVVHPRMVDVEHGWWFPEKEGQEPVFFGTFEANANVLCPSEEKYCSPEVGSWPLTGLPARVRKVG